MCIQPHHQKLSRFRLLSNFVRRNKFLFVIGISIIVVVSFQWHLATHYVNDLHRNDYFQTSFESFLGTGGRSHTVHNNALRANHADRSSSSEVSGTNILGQLYSTVEEIISPANQDSIPRLFTPVDEQHLHNGRVIRELSQRVLSRNIAQSNVLVVSPNFDQVRVYNPEDKSDDASDIHYPAKKAIEEGHTTHLLPSHVDFANGWVDAADQKHDSTNVGWILLTYFATQHFGSTSSPTIDEILSPTNDAVQSWLSNTTITYIVFPIQATAKIPLASILTDEEYAYEMDYTVDKSIEMIGLQAAEALLSNKYKLQLLSSSHYFDKEDDNAFYYGPNALFQNVKQLHRFLYQRAVEVLRAEVRHIRKQRHSVYKSIGTEQMFKVSFHALIFATQGLDLAIPARSSYVDVGNHRVCKDPNGKRKKKCDPKLNPRAHNNTIFLECPKRHETVKVYFAHGSVSVYRWPDRMKSATTLEKDNDMIMDIKEKWLVESDVETGEIEVWRGHDDANKAEALCVKTDKSSLLPSVACTTRVLPVASKSLPPVEHEKLMKKPNLLVVMIDPLSRQQLRRSLSNTWALMKLMGFVDFQRYTAVGKNSGPNQAALFSGVPLDGRDIRSSDNAIERVWLWDRLREAGYITMKAEDGCVRNSNMVQSIDPQTHHGEQLQEMFCFSYDRPNCLGSKLAAEHLMDYTLRFIKTYDRQENKLSDQAKPWASFISFIDSHEDTSTLISYVDTLFVSFLQDVIAMKSPTMILFLSDHGLHYGPTLDSDSGLAERAQPTLMMRLPSFEKNAGINAIEQNANLFTTAFDVHETILDVLLQESSSSVNSLGRSLVKALPAERSKCTNTKAIPGAFCHLIEPKNSQHHGQCTFMIDPPSILTFYSDIPQANRPVWPESCPTRGNAVRTLADPEEYCVEFRDSSYTLRSCGMHELDQRLELDIHVTINATFVDKKKSVSSKSARKGNLPNIIFLEIDSVSLSYSERFFPKTWSLLKHHEIVSSPDGTKTCPTGWCAAAFNQTSVVGQSSIVNQLAALSGCTNKKDEQLQFFKPGTSCYSGGTNSTKEDHWIFDVAKRLGYITFFGEEFCYEESPYVVQTQTAFTLNEDLTPHRLFCDLAKESIRRSGKRNAHIPTWDVDYESEEVPGICFGNISRGEIGLAYITQMFEQYADMPKFAFINALAAHDYSLDGAHVSLGSEHYDIIVKNFLASIMSRNDERPTFIVLRSDHGLQGGPYPVDYSSQIEHMHPWTTILAPADLAHLSIESLASNQDRLVTGFDIYNSMRSIMSQETTDLIGIPPWSYDLLQDIIPSERSCVDAKIPSEFCPCIMARSDMAPSFYIGHSEQPNKYHVPGLIYDRKSQAFIPRKPNGILSPVPERSFVMKPQHREVTKPLCNTTLDSYINQEVLRESWEMIENITSRYNGAEVSGGIFLYPRQSILLAYLIQQEIASTSRRVNAKTKQLEPFRICETGFGSGHSSALFLSVSPDVEVISFDLFNRPYQLATANALNSYFDNRLKVIIGDSCYTLKQYQSQCHFLHGSSLCETDNIDLINQSGAGVTLTSTAMDSLEDSSVYFGKRSTWASKKFGPDAQWATLFKKGCIENISCFEEESRTLDGSLRLARGKEQTISHRFCFATNTGKCGQSTHQATKSSSWQKEDFCQAWMVSHPN